MSIGAVAVMDGPIPPFDQFKEFLAQRIQDVPRCTQVLRTEWRADPEFDLARHVQRVALPQPGDDGELFQVIAHTLERPLALNRPLWECWIIEGLQDDRWAILMKIHHCMADEVSPAHLLTRLCDDADTDLFATDVAVKSISHSQTPPRSWTETVINAYATAFKTAARVLCWPAIWMSPAESVATRRRYGTVRVPRADVDAVSRKFGVTANDVALAVITEGFRSVLLGRGEEPRADSLRTVANADDRISALLPYLPVEHDDPVAQLRAVHGRLRQHDQRPAPNGLDTPFILAAKAFQTLTRLPQRFVTLATNAAGPRRRLRLMGQRVDQLLPIPPTAQQLSTGVAVLSYGDELVFGITAEYGAGSDMTQLIAGIERGMARLVALSQDSVLLFAKNRRKRTVRPSRGRVAAHPARARR
ncbi:diacylglycerol O-acyltransferase [Mycobacterium bourgelatii]|uniref:diacylglycerol O-acyltransferase n=2 Tax=Mycobacterium bourgelatii TaxID=1273442 RepID=A0A7I9YJE1_MYCBU|nr:diacylglycerol O-acyltransferase [Mycobacterium bourgelatii]